MSASEEIQPEQQNAKEHNQEQPDHDIRPTVSEWSWCGMFARHWISFYFFFGLQIHIGCLIGLLFTETPSGDPAVGTAGVIQMIMGWVMYGNIMIMFVMVFFEAQRYRRQLNLDGNTDNDDDFGIEPSNKQARKELKFISLFSSNRWRDVFHFIGVVGGFSLKYSSMLLGFCALANFIRIYIPSRLIPVFATKYIQFSLAIVSLANIIFAMMLVLNWVYFRYSAAKAEVSQMLMNEK